MKIEKYQTEIECAGGIILVHNRLEGVHSPSLVQLQIEDKEGYAFVDIRDEQVDELVEALKNAKTIVKL